MGTPLDVLAGLYGIALDLLPCGAAFVAGVGFGWILGYSGSKEA